ncbi:right-handed parallel beta-helix repeat-containing protein, partial [Candidatus Laterigemmans baculatus]|uniref:right-handed parallel beta-helix repeat-containing protein n=1 Tax=Candidatus Laterigemmans baculatus TaxID=2770505 RepID=UPI0013D99C27
VDGTQPLTEQFTITSLGAGTIGLSRPVGHDRPAAVDGDLVTVSKDFDGQELRGHVANLTRNVALRSENPSGNRGHFMAVGRANVDLRYAAFVGLGRTSNANLDSTVFASDGTVSHEGTNQVGRYSLHLHHLSGPAEGLEADPAVDPAGLARRQFRLIGNAVSDGEKWGITVHGSHYGQIAGNVVHDIAGAGIVTEDGSESFNNFTGNFVLGVEGTGSTGRYDEEGRRGAGFWFRGNHNYISDNVVAAAEEGYGFYIQNASGNSQQANMRVHIPRFPGASTHMEGQYEVRTINSLPLPEFSDNEVYAATQFGVGLWSIQALPKDQEPVFEDTVIWNSTGTAVFLDYSTARFDGLTVRGHASNPTAVAVRGHNANGNSGPLTIRRFDFQQVRHGYTEDSRTVHSLVFEDGYVRNYEGFRISTEQQGLHPRRYIFRDVKFDPVAGHELSAIDPVYDFRWSRGGTYLAYVLHDIQILMYDYQGVSGENFRVFFDQQDPEAVIDKRWITRAYAEIVDWELDGRQVPIRQHYYRLIGSKEGPITVGEAWEKHRSVFMNAAAIGADSERHPEVGLTKPLEGEGLPPFERGAPVPAFLFSGNRTSHLDSTVELRYKGIAAAGAGAIYFSVDGGPWLAETDDDGVFTLSGLTPGEHTITSAYGSAAGEVWGTRMTESFSVRADASTPSVPLLLSPATSGTAGTVRFSWTSVVGATSYELVVEDEEGRLVYQGQTSATELTPPSELGEGSYRVRVRAEVDGSDEPLWSPW